MQQLSELTRSWTDALTALSVGSLMLLLSFGSKINPDGSLTLSLRTLDTMLSFTKDFSSISTLVYGLMLLSLVMAVGYFTIQLGELIAIFREYKDKGLRFRKRMEKCGSNPALMAMFSNAYTSYRLLCGLGGALLLSGFLFFFRGIVQLSVTPIGIGVFFLSFGLMIVVFYARYSFASLDWALFGDLRE